MHSHLKYRPDIDGLRSIAILPVVAYHANLLGITGGYVGVDVFFVISGFLITQLLANELTTTGTISLKRFYSRRILRLLPALLFVIIVSLLFWLFFLNGLPDETKKVTKSVSYAMQCMANVFFKNHTGGYFDGPTEQQPFLHLWSLAVEEQFYFVWPILMLLLHRWTSRKITILFLVAIIFGSLICAQYLLNNSVNQAAFYLMPPRAWELAIGALLVFIREPLLAFAEKKSPAFIHQLSVFACALGLVCICVPFFAYSPETLFPGLAALPPVIGTALVIASGSLGPHTLSRFLSIKPLVKIGLLSYGWYLWHWPFLAMLRAWNLGETPDLSLRLIVVFGSLLMAQVSLQFVESPIRFNKKIQLRPTWQIITAGITACVATALFANSIKNIESWVITKTNNMDLVNSVNARPPLANCVDSVERVKNNQCSLDFSKQPDAPHLIVWGDSHGHSYLPMVMTWAEEIKGRATLYSRSGSPSLVPHPQFFIENKEFTDKSTEFSKAVLQDIEQKVKTSQFPVSIVLASRWVAYTGKKLIPVTDKARQLTQENTLKSNLDFLEESLSSTLKELSQLGVHKILVLADYPEFKYNVLRCYKKNPQNCLTSVTDMQTYTREAHEVLLRVVKKYPNVQLADPVHYMCDDGNCPQFLSDSNGNLVPSVFDDDHASVEASRILGKRMASELQWLISR